MILIADGGSTKTDWRLIKEGREYKKVQTSGFNPYLVGSDEIEEILWKELQPYIDNTSVSIVYYYGAGCSTPVKNMIVETAFEKVFPNARLNINHDLLAAAHALCGDEEGIAAILGTGSNSCYYDGKDIRDGIFSLGYFFGDEGSGAYLGKQLLIAYLHKELPEEIDAKFRKEYVLSNENILDAVYSKAAPSRFLASFSRFINENREHPYIYNLLTEAFRAFYKYQVCCYARHKEIPVHFVGSVAFHYNDILTEVGLEFGVKTGKFIEAPIDGLVEYHKDNQ
ncbi:MAG: ATPase [Lentimicrobiaceae bacterium]|jgi:N-acetylglucosamine kinase-like BadF-type ATPase